jgi:outer membrane protein assembly factor BamB
VIVAGMDGYVYIIDLREGRKLWSFNTGSPVSSSPAIAGGKIYILTEDGRLLAFSNKK